MLKNKKLLKYFIILIFTNILSCNSNTLGPEYFDDGSFYYYQDGKINLYPSRSVMLLKFKDNTLPSAAKKILNDYRLEFYSKIYSNRTSFEDLVSNNERIIVRLINKKNTAANFITKYPKASYTSSRFGNLPEVSYCLPTYSIDGSQEDYKRVFITGEIVFKVLNESVSKDYLLQKYNLKYIPREYMGENVYLCELTDLSHEDPLTTANELHEEPDVLWASPDFMTFIQDE